MNNEEPQASQIANLQIAHTGHKLPEQAKVASCNIPRPFGFMNLINQWQPMGIRVVLNIPFIGNDKDYLFAIRNGPFIPRFDKFYYDYEPVSDDVNQRKIREMSTYAWNNMRNVIHAKPTWAIDNDTKQSIYITQYDYPPPLAQFATMFRKWRGTMQYRIRTVAGFTTQGYPFISMIRNMPSEIGIYDENSVLPAVQRQDISYREAMQNSYIMGDTAMVRHFEFSVPYEYPTPWYDQFAWISRRVRPSQNFHATSTADKYEQLAPLVNEPHGDNYIVVGLRGALNTSVNEAQISFELEYRAGEDFQFSDPGLPLGDFLLPMAIGNEMVPKDRDGKNLTKLPLRQVPNKNYTSDGIYWPTPTSRTARASSTSAADYWNSPEGKAELEKRRRAAARTTRNKRDVDEVDSDNESIVSDISDISSLGTQNMRKALRNLNL